MFFKYLKKYWYLCLLTSLMVICETIVELVQPDYMAQIVDQGVGGRDVDLIINLAIRMVILCIFMGVTGFLGSIFGNMASQKFGNDLRKDMFRRTMSLSIEQTDYFTTGSLVNRLSDDVTRVQDSVKVAFRGIVRYAFMLLGGIYMIYLQSPVFALVAVCSLPFLLFFIIFFLKRSTPLFSDVQKKLDGISNIMQEDIIGMRVIKAFRKESGEEARFESKNNDMYKSSLRVQYLLAYLSPCMNIVLNLCVAAVILIGGYSVQADSAITPGRVMAAITYFALILTGASVLGNLSQTFIRARASWVRIREVMNCESTIKDGNSNSASLTGDVEFRNVSFSYPSSNVNAVENVSFHLEHGKTLGIIGPTGCGKTSLANLIPRFYEANEGEILIDGINVRDYSTKDLRDKISYTLQESEMFSRSIRENIKWGNSSASDKEINEACETAQALDFISSSPDEFETMVTEKGHSISGGQKQRIAIARSLVKPCEILILDDSTSALDLKTEAQFYKALNESRPELTKIIIAQRIASIINSDLIAVMDNGRVVALGSHDELLKGCKLYAEIYNSQLKGGESIG